MCLFHTVVLRLCAPFPTTNKTDPNFLAFFLRPVVFFGRGDRRGLRSPATDRPCIFLELGPLLPSKQLHVFDVASGAHDGLSSARQGVHRRRRNPERRREGGSRAQANQCRGLPIQSVQDGKYLLVALSGRLYLIDRARPRSNPCPPARASPSTRSCRTHATAHRIRAVTTTVRVWISTRAPSHR